MTLPSAPKLQRILALALLAALLLLSWLQGVQPMLDLLGAVADQRALSLRALKRDRALLRQAETLRKAADAVDRSPRWHSFYVASRSDSAPMQMESELRGIFRESNNPAMISAEPTDRRGGKGRIGVRVSSTMRIDQLAQVLDRIQKLPHHLSIESLVIQAPESQGSQVNSNLSVQMEISGLLLTAPAGDSGA